MDQPIDWTAALVGQLDFYWEAHLWPRLAGLTDHEYLWEPVADCWTIRPDASGNWLPDGRDASDEELPRPAPVTTIAWRLCHIAVGCFAIRVSTFFGDGSRPNADMFDPRHLPASLPATARDALDYLGQSYRSWHDATARLSPTELATPLGPKGAVFGDQPMAELILHINRETMHHGGEIGLLRDLYLRAGR
jgi:hypothetical protein